MRVQRLRATAISLPQQNTRKETSTLSKKDAETGNEDFPHPKDARDCRRANRIRTLKLLFHERPQLAKFASKLGSMSQSMRFFPPPFSMEAVHVLQKRISFSQWPAEKTGTSGTIGANKDVQRLSAKSDPMMVKTSAVILP